MPESRFIKNFTVVSSYVLSVGKVFFDGFICVVQTGDLFPSYSWIKIPAFFANLTEGEIYRQNLIGGFSFLPFITQKNLSKYLVIRALENLLQEHTESERELREKLFLFLNKIKADDIWSEEEKKALNHDISQLTAQESQDLNKEKLESFFSNYETLSNTKQVADESTITTLATRALEFNALKQAFQVWSTQHYALTCSWICCYQANQAVLQHTSNAKAKAQAEARLKLLMHALMVGIYSPYNVALLMGKRVSFECTDELLNEHSETTHSNFLDIPPAVITSLQKVLSHTQTKLWLLRVAVFISILSATATVVSAIYIFPAVLIATLSAVPVLLPFIPVIVWIIAIFAGIAYGILIYNTLAKLIINETITTWWAALQQELGHDTRHPLKYLGLVVWKVLSQLFYTVVHWMQRKPNESYLRWFFRLFLSVLIVAVGIMATLAGGYTTFIQLHSYVNLAVCIVTVLGLSLSDLLFTLTNSFDAIPYLTNIAPIKRLSSGVSAWWQKLITQIRTENCLQWSLFVLRLPLILAHNLLKLAIFLCHIFFTGVSSDKFFNIPRPVVMCFAAFTELFTDLFPLFGENEAVEHHDHGGLFACLGIVIFITPATLLGTCNWLFSQLNRCYSNSTTSATTPKVLTIREAILQEWQQFGIWHKHHVPENNTPSSLTLTNTSISTKIIQRETSLICEKEIKRLEGGFFHPQAKQEKAEIFKKIKEKLATNPSPDAKLISDDEYNKLNKHRHCILFHSSSTKSQVRFEKIQRVLAYQEPMPMACTA